MIALDLFSVFNEINNTKSGQAEQGGQERCLPHNFQSLQSLIVGTSLSSSHPNDPKHPGQGGFHFVL